MVPVNALYELRWLQQRFGSTLALDIPALEIWPGRFHTLVGPNGSGKTTLLALLAFLSRPSSGELRFAGEPVTWTRSSLLRLRRQVTLVHQSPYLFSGTVADNLTIGLRHRELPPERTRELVADVLEKMDLVGYAEREARTLSGGEARRVAVARALLPKPRVLLFDEPLANLDPKSTGVLEDLIGELPGAGHTVVMSSHDPRHPERFGGEVLDLRGGKIASSGLRLVAGKHTGGFSPCSGPSAAS